MNATAAADADRKGLVENRYHAYVIELDGLGIRQTDKPRVYVGVSRYTPEARFAQHRSGTRASKRVQNLGVRLRPDLMEHQPALRSDPEAKAYERVLFEQLALEGWPAKGGT